MKYITTPTLAIYLWTFDNSTYVKKVEFTGEQTSHFNVAQNNLKNFFFKSNRKMSFKY